MVDFIIRHLEVPEIYNYLAENDQMFKPPMSARLNILNYAKKLIRKVTLWDFQVVISIIWKPGLGL